MEIGAGLGQLDIRYDPTGLREYAQAVEGLGFSFLLSGDHVLGGDPGEYTGPRTTYSADYHWHEPFVLFSHLAAVTTRLRFVSGVLILSQRQTALVAKQAAQLDFLSGGRLSLGVGVGWNEPEYVALNEPFGNRGSRMAEQFAVLRALWMQPLVTFDGRWHHIHSMGLNPRPLQQPIPLWIGGSAAAVLKRTGRIADGWIFQWPADQPQTPELARRLIEQVRGYAAAAGRDPTALSIQTNVAVTPESTPDDWRRSLDEWRSLAVTQVVVRIRGMKTADSYLAALRRFAEEMGLT